MSLKIKQSEVITVIGRVKHGRNVLKLAVCIQMPVCPSGIQNPVADVTGAKLCNYLSAVSLSYSH